MKEKAQAYDRLMSGGKVTLKEIANILGMVTVVDKFNRCFAFKSRPIYEDHGWKRFYEYTESRPGMSVTRYKEDRGICLENVNIAFEGKWGESITEPDRGYKND